MREKVSGLTHEVVAAFRASIRRVEISTKDLRFSTHRTAKSPKGAEVQHVTSVPVILAAMPDNSFDVVSIVDMPEVLNAVQQTIKEVQTRFDLKNSKSDIQLNEKDKKITVTSIDEFKLKAVVDVLQQKLVKRKVPLKNFVYNPVQPAAGSMVRQEVTIHSGLAVEKSKEIVRTIKDSKIRVQASIQGDLVRVSGKSRDLLQEVIQLLRQSDFGVELQFTNYRTN